MQPGDKGKARLADRAFQINNFSGTLSFQGRSLETAKEERPGWIEEVQNTGPATDANNFIFILYKLQ
jgi:hypothetical protein